MSDWVRGGKAIYGVLQQQRVINTPGQLTEFLGAIDRRNEWPRGMARRMLYSYLEQRGVPAEIGRKSDIDNSPAAERSAGAVVAKW